MKTVEISSAPVSVAELLNMARGDPLLVKTPEGDSFVISQTDEFATEVELLRRNHEFLAMLDDLKKERELIPWDQAVKGLLP
jgi:hypothetical protein